MGAGKNGRKKSSRRYNGGSRFLNPPPSLRFVDRKGGSFGRNGSRAHSNDVEVTFAGHARHACKPKSQPSSCLRFLFFFFLSFTFSRFSLRIILGCLNVCYSYLL